MKGLIKVTLILSMLVFAISCGANNPDDGGGQVDSGVSIKIDDLEFSSTTHWNIGASSDVPNITDFNSVASSDNKFIKITANATIDTTEAMVARTAVEIKNLLESELTPKQKTIFTLGEPFKKPEVVRSRLTTTTKELTFMTPIIANEGYKLDEDTGYEFTVALSGGDWKYIELTNDEIQLTLNNKTIGSVPAFGSVDNSTVPLITFTTSTSPTFNATAKSIKHASLKNTATADSVRNVLADEVTSDKKFTLGKTSSTIAGKILTVKVAITPKVGYTNSTTTEYSVGITLDEGGWTSGDADTPIYEISTSADLIWLTLEAQERINFEGKTVRFMNDIDMNNELFDGISQFNGGTMDGNGKTIKNLKIDKTGTPNVWNYSVGLINEMRGGTIKNLTIESGSIIGRADIFSGIGAFVGASYGVITITGVTNRASVTLESSDHFVAVGGIIGNVRGSITILETENFGDISSATSVGGIIGSAELGHITIKNTKNFGKVESSGSSGGIIGSVRIASSVIIENTENSGDVDAGRASAGGIIGHVASAPATIKNTKNSGDVTSTGAPSGESEVYRGTGGIIGIMSHDNFTIENTENSGDVSGIDHAGGIIGWVFNIGITITNTANTGEIASTGNDKAGIGGIIGQTFLFGKNYVKIDLTYSYAGAITGSGIKGGIVGLSWKDPNDDSELKINNSFYLDTMSSAVGKIITDGINMGGYVPKDVGSKKITVGEFSTQSTFAGWDFNNVWKMSGSYPILK